MGRKPKSLTENDIASKQKILNASREVFAEKGYDGASIADIAQRAGVNKALPYYYFENKKNILQELVKSHVDVLFAKRQASIKESGSINKESIENFYDRFMHFSTEGKDYLRILITELMKDSPESGQILRSLSPAFDEMAPVIRQHGLEAEEEIDLKIRAFFLSFIPVTMFQILGEKWAEYYNIDKDELMERFKKAFKATYIKQINELYFDEKGGNKK